MGNAHLLPVDRVLLPVHPHVHGERHIVVPKMPGRHGSSPRTWGTQRADRCVIDLDRFIPTYMGNANENSVSSAESAVHPHVHGERAPKSSATSINPGSSPRTWGTHIRYNTGVRGGRFIPTYMGNASRTPSIRRCRTVHPHVHGERKMGIPGILTGYGSSPRTWGTLFLPGAENFEARFIPTYMGNAVSARNLSTMGAVHPHVHGERTHGIRRMVKMGGSSPRTWGTPSPPSSA